MKSYVILLIMLISTTLLAQLSSLESIKKLESYTTKLEKSHQKFRELAKAEIEEALLCPEYVKATVISHLALSSYMDALLVKHIATIGAVLSFSTIPSDIEDSVSEAIDDEIDVTIVDLESNIIRMNNTITLISDIQVTTAVTSHISIVREAINYLESMKSSDQ